MRPWFRLQLEGQVLWFKWYQILTVFSVVRALKQMNRDFDLDLEFWRKKAR